VRRPLRRLGDWWGRRRGRRSRLLDLLGRGGGDDADPMGVREPRRPKTPSLSGGIALEEPDPRGPSNGD